MATYYADFDLATGDNDGSDAANAWKTFADVIAGSNGTAPAAGDTVLCKGTDTLSGTTRTINISGSAASGYIKLIGVDASWNNVGGSSRAVIDANGGAIVALTYNAASFIWLENFRVTNTNKASGKDGIGSAAAYSEYNIFINCVADNCNNGFAGGGYLRYHRFIRCLAHTNTANGFSSRYAQISFCRAYGNTNHGFHLSDNVAFASLAHDNGADGFYVYGSSVIQCSSYGNTGDGFELSLAASNTNGFVACRAGGNGGAGFNVSAAGLRMPVFYYYGDNTTETAGNYDEILNDGASTVTLNGTDTNEGFVDPANDDYNLRSDATFRRVAVSLP